jgi:undecaprenyl-diphosphatase
LEFLEKIIQYDKELFIWLNGLGNESWDAFWIAATNMFSWIPLYLFLFFLIFKAFGWKKGLILVLITALMVTFSDQFANLIKHSVERLRPNNDPSINQFIRILHTPRGFSFYSAHAGTSMAVTTFMYKTLKNRFQYIYLLYLWPVFFAYSRIYVGVHYPIDVLTGAFTGFLIGWLFYTLSQLYFKRFPVKAQ